MHFSEMEAFFWICIRKFIFKTNSTPCFRWFMFLFQASESWLDWKGFRKPVHSGCIITSNKQGKATKYPTMSYNEPKLPKKIGVDWRRRVIDYNTNTRPITLGRNPLDTCPFNPNYLHKVCRVTGVVRLDSSIVGGLSWFTLIDE